MYNKNDKMEWIKEYTTTNTVDEYRLPKIFERTEPYEEKLQKDLCDFSADEAMEMFVDIGYSNLQFAKVEASLIRSYVDWQITKGKSEDGVNHFSIQEIPQTKLKQAVKQKTSLVDRRQIEVWCNRLYNPSDKVVLLGLFEGIKGSDYCEFVNLSRDDIDEETCKVKLFGRNETLKISEKLVRYMIESCETNYYTTYGNVRSGHVFEASNLVIKNAPNAKEEVDDFRKGRRIYSRIKMLLRFLGVDGYINSGAIVNSGIVETIKDESSRLGISWRNFVVSTEGRETIYKRFRRRIQPFEFMLEYEDFFG